MKNFINFLYFVDLFKYPSNKDEILELVESKVNDKELYEIFNEFKNILMDSNGIESLQELYVRAFDLMPIFYPYLSYHIHYDSFNRNSMMIEIREIYKQNNFTLDRDLNELPDNLFIVFKFLQQNPNYCQKFLKDYIVPALENFVNSASLSTSILENVYIKLLNYVIRILNVKRGEKVWK